MPRLRGPLDRGEGMYKIEPRSPRVAGSSYRRTSRGQLRHGKLLDEVGYHCRDYFLHSGSGSSSIGGILAHSPRKGLGSFDASCGLETPRIIVTPHRLPRERCEPHNRLSRSATVDAALERHQDVVVQPRRNALPRRQRGGGRFASSFPNSKSKIPRRADGEGRRLLRPLSPAARSSVWEWGLEVEVDVISRWEWRARCNGRELDRNESRGFPVVAYDWTRGKRRIPRRTAHGKAVAGRDRPERRWRCQQPRRVCHGAAGARWTA